MRCRACFVRYVRLASACRRVRFAPKCVVCPFLVRLRFVLFAPRASYVRFVRCLLCALMREVRRMRHMSVSCAAAGACALAPLRYALRWRCAAPVACAPCAPRAAVWPPARAPRAARPCVACRPACASRVYSMNRVHANMWPHAVTQVLMLAFVRAVCYAPQLPCVANALSRASTRSFYGDQGV